MKRYMTLFYIKDQETNEWIQSNFRVTRCFFTLEEAIQYVNDSNADAVKDLRNKGYSVGWSVVPFNKRDENVEYSIVTHAYITGCLIDNNFVFKYEIICKE